jgi:hypothetical protein
MLLRAKVGYIISDNDSNTTYYTERFVPYLLIIPVIITSFAVFVWFPDAHIAKYLPALMLPIIIISYIFAGSRKIFLTFYKERDTLTPLFIVESSMPKWGLWNRFNVKSSEGQELGSIVMTDKKSFLPRWEVTDATGNLGLRAVSIPFSLSDKFRLLAGHGDETVGYISTNVFQREYRIRFSRHRTAVIDNRLMLAFLTIIFDNQTINNI